MQTLDVTYDTNKLTQYAQEGKTPIILTDGKNTAIIAVADAIRPGVTQALERFAHRGINTIMITGDDQRTAEYIAQQVGIKTVFAQTSPSQKAHHIQQLKQDGHRVAMVGDGINDAPALAFADVSIAMSTGTDVAMHTADVTLLHGDVTKLMHAFRLSAKTMRIIVQNLFWAFGYNILLIPLATGLFIPLF